jgi:hypothetical protein
VPQTPGAEDATGDLKSKLADAADAAKDPGDKES